MSLMPEFELGLWNAWILMLSSFLLIIPLWVLDRLKGWKSSSRPGTWPLNETEKKLDRIALLIAVAFIIYSFFLPLKLGTAWLYVGLLVYLFGCILTFVAAANLSSTPTDRPATKGLYRISRNPVYLGMILSFIGIGIACASWLWLLLGAINTILQHILIASEERWCLEKYGDAYREYMNRTPRWIGIPKSEKRD
jgi:protein-S-isoprenylcysteine O-methyltransferase Ste14